MIVLVRSLTTGWQAQDLHPEVAQRMIDSGAAKLPDEVEPKSLIDKASQAVNRMFGHSANAGV